MERFGAVAMIVGGLLMLWGGPVYLMDRDAVPLKIAAWGLAIGSIGASAIFISEGYGMWVAIVVGTVMSFALSGLKIWTSHRERMAKMEQDAKIAESMQ